MHTDPMPAAPKATVPGDPGPTIARLLRAAAGALGGASDSPRLDAELLLAHALGWRREWLYARDDERPPADALARFGSLLEERRRGRPVAQLLGRKEFRSLAFLVSPDVLTPRPETELLVEAALAALAALPAAGPADVLELGTGSGAIAVSLVAARPRTRVLASDASEAALAVATENADRLLAGPDRPRFVHGDWFGAVPPGLRFDLVLSNPPYLDDADWQARAPELDHEPRLALYGGADGLEALRLVAAGAPAHLRPGGSLLVEHGASQGAGVRRLFAAVGLSEVRTLTDTAGRERVTAGRMEG